MRIRALAAALSGLLVLHAAAVEILPPAFVAAEWLSAASDPVRLADLGLAETLTADRVDGEIRAALDGGDTDLAASFLALADERSLPVDAGLRAAVEAAAAPSFTRTTGAFLEGAVFGTVEDGSGLAGAIAGDLVGIGDVRDFSREGWRALNGEDPDEIVLALSAAGLAVTAATWASLGASTPARAGLTAIKVARRAGRLSAPLVARLGRLAAEVIDRAALRTAVGAMGRGEITAARRSAVAVVRAERAEPILAMARDTVRIGAKAGVRTADEVLALAHSPAEIARAARLADRFGPATRATVKLLGRGAIVLTKVLTELVGWIFAALGWAFAAASAAAAFGRWLARATRRRGGLRSGRHPLPIPRPVQA